MLFCVQPGEPVPPAMRRGRDSARRLASGGSSEGDGDRTPSPPHLRQPDPLPSPPPATGPKPLPTPHLQPHRLEAPPLAEWSASMIRSCTLPPSYPRFAFKIFSAPAATTIQNLGIARNKKRARIRTEKWSKGNQKEKVTNTVCSRLLPGLVQRFVKVPSSLQPHPKIMSNPRFSP
ncbi:uncharacterized protein [Lolium perenne]|uniref:uncharacterized protein isoform X2 n=1 Tax=Lolium perenne TaxID=4522 RepID=UPI003A9A5BCB